MYDIGNSMHIELYRKERAMMMRESYSGNMFSFISQKKQINQLKSTHTKHKTKTNPDTHINSSETCSPGNCTRNTLHTHRLACPAQ